MIYRFTATVASLKGFMRRYELRGADTLYDFHEHIVNDLNFAPDQMVLFRVESAKGKPLKEYGLFDLGDGSMDEISIEKLVKQQETTLLYVFDMRDNRVLRLSFVGTDEELPRKSYPRTSDEKGDAPSQFLDRQGPEAYEDDEEV
ncbi:MAG: plasmid pRiA4b ORF-3 family protein [Prevotellaceae bacterium]|nr:plasmid pRiA4b ORF-3 family protein [Prevotellaceae bacterium]